MAALGNLIRLSALQLHELPHHTKLDGAIKQSSDGKVYNPRNATDNDSSDDNTSDTLDQDGCPKLTVFIKEVLDQAKEFIDDTLSSTFREESLKTSPPATAQVRLLSRDITSAQLDGVPWLRSRIPRQPPADKSKSGEAWFARRSRHANRSQEGTADFGEFDYGLREDHSEHEQQYTPDIFDSFKVLEWDLEHDGEELLIDDYSQIKMTIYEICHRLPFPLSPRAFPELVVTAKTGPLSFIVVQIPVNISSLPEAFYSNARNSKEGDTEIKRKRPVLGAYISIERCRIAGDQSIELTMATASDAKGSLPMWTQKLGVPGAIVKDVGFLIKWISQRRRHLSAT
ncbi:hypothetical protein MMC07_003306 [Pseudocyphellaria aurata]|nr:hypothetical protein [Pseudocyphellaria aurata]